MRTKVFSSRYSIGLFWNGFNINIAHAVLHHLARSGATVLGIQRPLSEIDRHQKVTSTQNEHVMSRLQSIKFKYPLSLVLDLFAAAPIFRLRTVVIFSAHVGLVAAIFRKFRLIGSFAYWNIDFSPQRFRNTIMDAAYRLCDRVCVATADLHIEVSTAALEQRARRYRYTTTDRHIVVPVGIDPQRVSQPDPQGWMRGRIATVGYLRPGLANDVLIDALSILSSRGERIVLDLIGDGPQLAELKLQAENLKLSNIVFHGAVAEDEKFRILNQASVGIALYHPSPGNFTQFADPGKLKDYLAAAMPIVMNDVPATTEEYVNSGAATVVELDPQLVADAISSHLDQETYVQRSHASHRMAQRYLWPVILKEFESRLLCLSASSSQKSEKSPGNQQTD